MREAITRSEVVSFEEEPLILVDSNDNPIGSATKRACHDGTGRLHRAFSIFIANENGELLLQQRAAGKRLWPSYWSNSCCSHPRLGEDMLLAAGRRMQEELGITAELTYLYKFEYQAQYLERGSEHELCSVYIGTTFDEPRVNDAEVQDWTWIKPEKLHTRITEGTAAFTPWMRMEWKRMLAEHRSQLPLDLRGVSL